LKKLLAMDKRKILCVVGTRPEAIKMAPLVLKLKEDNWADVKILATAQHRSLLDQTLGVFNIVPDFDLNVMEPDQTLSGVFSKMLSRADDVISSFKPDCIVVQGDTTTVLSLALAGFYRKIRIAHLEAGLRTHDLQNPFPEEANRKATSVFTDYHFAPTDLAKNNLIAEGYPEGNIFITGNTVIDSLLMVAKKFEQGTHSKEILLTVHRRENFGKPLENVLIAIAKIADEFPDYFVTFPVHPNPNIRRAAEQLLLNKTNVQMVDPLNYQEFVEAMGRADFVVTDSGGVQEEAPALGKPVLVLREETERPEAVNEGLAILVGTNSNEIYKNIKKLIVDRQHYDQMAKGYSPYGDGLAAIRIAKVLKEKLL
jgi:UDP-N-acetylglucosamine 2-epimerase (non-hydrolysing)